MSVDLPQGNDGKPFPLHRGEGGRAANPGPDNFSPETAVSSLIRDKRRYMQEGLGPEAARINAGSRLVTKWVEHNPGQELPDELRDLVYGEALVAAEEATPDSFKVADVRAFIDKRRAGYEEKGLSPERARISAGDDVVTAWGRESAKPLPGKLLSAVFG